MFIVFFFREKLNLNLIIDVLVLVRIDCMCRCLDRWSKYCILDIKGKVFVIKRIIYVILYLGYYLVYI